jgi:dihydropteroate synthase
MPLTQTQLVGILNLTPDSFSDGGLANHPLERLTQLIADGAKVIDIGAESTRPNATPLTAEEEWERLKEILPPAITLCHQHHIKVSLDSYHPENILKALPLGLDWVNDVSALNNPEIIDALQSYPQASYVLMHSLGIPANSAITLPENTDPVEAIMAFFVEKLALLQAANIAPERVILDVGIGFGKTPEQSLQLMRRIGDFHELGCRLLVGHSRKSCLARFTNKAPAGERDGATLAASLALARQGVHYLRVHEVKLHTQAMATAEYFDV